MEKVTYRREVPVPHAVSDPRRGTYSEIAGREMLSHGPRSSLPARMWGPHRKTVRNCWRDDPMGR